MGFFIFIGIIVFVVVIIVGAKSAEKTRANWHTAARSLGLQFVPGNLFNIGTIMGTREGHQINVKIVSKGSGKNSDRVTRFTVTYRRPIPIVFKIKHQTVFHGIKKALGLGDDEVGDPSFDDIALIECRDIEQLQRFLTNPIRRAMTKILMAYADIRITNRSIEVDLKGAIGQYGLLTSNIRRLEQFADAVVAPFEPKHSRKHKKKREKRKFAPRPPGPRIEVSAPPPLPDVVEPQTASLPESPAVRLDAGDKELADLLLPPERIAVPANSTLPVPPSLPTEKTPKKTEDRKTPAPEKIPELPPRPDPASEPLRPESQTEFCETFFSPDFGTLDASRRFDEEFKGARVQWSGKLEAATKFSIDFVFEGRTGVKATFEIQSLGNAYGGGKVKAVVQFSEDDLPALKSRLRKKAGFSGTLFRLDALTKTVFLTDGKLEEARAGG